MLCSLRLELDRRRRQFCLSARNEIEVEKNIAPGPIKMSTQLSPPLFNGPNVMSFGDKIVQMGEFQNKEVLERL